MRAKAWLIPLAILFTCAGALAQETRDFRVIVNPSNPTSSLTREQVAKMFFKLTTNWADGTRVQPVDQGETSPVRRSFSEAVHGRGVGAVKAFWQRQIFSGRDVPPPEAPNDGDVITFVESNRGGIGYVSASAPLRTAKVVRIVQ